MDSAFHAAVDFPLLTFAVVDFFFLRPLDAARKPV
jgi:hypothetical protein